MREYKIEKLASGKKVIIYLINGEEESREHYANADGTIVSLIKEGYKLFIDKQNINEYKKSIFDKIDLISQNKIFDGFYFDGKVFSLSISAQINWSNLLFLPMQMFPITLSTKDDDIYLLTYSNVNSFYGAAVIGKNSPLQQGNTLKQQVKNLTTIEELDQFIIDNNL